jgi:hypothetical protein
VNCDEDSGIVKETKCEKKTCLNLSRGFIIGDKVSELGIVAKVSTSGQIGNLKKKNQLYKFVEFQNIKQFSLVLQIMFFQSFT